MKAFALAFLLALAGCAAPRPVAAAAQPAPVEVQVERDGPAWTAIFRLPRDAPAWAFIRSPLAEQGRQPYRTRSWRVDTPGVRLARRGRHDVLLAEHGNLPRTVTVRFTPFTGEVQADYAPALAFSGGTTALFDQQFAIFSAASAEAVAALPADLNGQPIDDSGTRVTFRDVDGPVLAHGRLQRRATIEGAPTYVLFGAARIVEREAMAALIDPQLPRWLAEALGTMTPAILSRYAEALGPRPAGRPTLLASWASSERSGASMNGGVVGGIIVMRFEGSGLLAPNAQALDLARWFVAHESAHFWLGETVRYEASRDAWITEGGADLLAVRSVAATRPGYDPRLFLDESIADCARLAAGRGIASAEERGEHRAYYACGTVFGLVAEAASGGPFERFARTLIDANRADGVLTRAEWLAELDRVSRDPMLSRDIGRLLDAGAEDPKAAIASLLRRAGVAFTLAEDGTPRLS